MSANLLVDLGGTCLTQLTLGVGGAGSGIVYPCSGAVIGAIVDMIHANTATQLVVAGNCIFGSGQLRLQIQTADATTSGSFTDPTSGLASFPGAFQSGGILILNSGATGGGLINTFTSGEAISSGFVAASWFQRPGRYARANAMSGDFFAGTLTVALVGQYKTTGSGGGFTLAPGSGSVNV